MAKKKIRTLHPDEPLLHADHPRPVTRRDFLRQGFISGSGAVLTPSMLSMLVASAPAEADLSEDMDLLKTACGIQPGAGKIPFICFDLAGGANLAGSNILAGAQGGIDDPLTASGYSKLGIAGDTLPDFITNANVDRTMGIPFHSQSSLLAGIKARFRTGLGAGNVTGSIIPARSANDTGNNPHNPMFGISMAGARGELLSLIGSRNSVSGGNSMSPSYMIDITKSPTKIDNPRDTSGLIDTGELVKKMGKNNASRVMEAIQRISAAKMSKVDSTNPAKTANVNDADVKKHVNCNYVKSAFDIDKFGDPKATNSNPFNATTEPDGDPDIATIFPPGDANGDMGNDRELRKTAAVMKLVVNGLAGAGTITMGGYDYHTGNRTTGDARDFRAGQCIGACLEYAHLLGKPLMIYVFSDGSVASNGTPDANAGGKLVWTGDNSSTASSLMLVYNPGSNPTLIDVSRQQLGWYRPDASVETNNSTPMANDVNALVEAVVLNYMALHGEEGQFENVFTNHRLGSLIRRDSITAFGNIT